jgi:alkylated DNA repair dioxygenase AlkB
MPDPFTILDLPGATAALHERFLSESEAGALFDTLRTRVRWEQHTVRLFGREVPSPRLSAWYGDPEAVYRYSGVTHRPHPWIPELDELRSRVELETGSSFNSVLLNLYRDGSDAMGWHADDEPELGPEPTIASVTLGAARRMRFRHRTRKEMTASVTLSNGSLLVMAGATQRHWLHAVPRTRTVHAERINLTFRRIQAVRQVRTLS